MSDERCKKTVTTDTFRGRKCSRKPWKDGYCKQHHPETAAKKQEEYRKRFDERMLKLRAAGDVSKWRTAVVEAACNFIEGEPQVLLLKHAVNAYRAAQKALDDLCSGDSQ